MKEHKIKLIDKKGWEKEETFYGELPEKIIIRSFKAEDEKFTFVLSREAQYTEI